MFTLVIPCYNNVELLKKTLAGLCRNQGGAAFEVILVDNNSFDEDINTAYEKYVRWLDLTLLRQPQLPHPKATSRARNLGLRLSRHKWVINLDADCVPCPGYLSGLAQYLSHTDKTNPIIVGLRQFVDLTGASDEDILNGRVDFAALPRVASPANYGQAVDRRLPFLQNLHTWEHPWAFFHSCNLIYLKQTALSVGGYDEIFDGCWGYEDVDFAHRMITCGGAQPVYLPGIDCYHQDSELSNRQNRFDKVSNRNWGIITQRIPGFASFKIRQYAALNKDIIC